MGDYKVTGVQACALPILAKLATPFTAATVVVPPSVLPPGLLPSATVMLPVKPGTRFPAGSSAVIWTAGLIAAPATVVVDWTVTRLYSGLLGMTYDAVCLTIEKPLALAVSV